MRIRVSAKPKRFGIVQCRHCHGSGLNVGGGNAGQLCLLLSHDAVLLRRCVFQALNCFMILQSGQIGFLSVRLENRISAYKIGILELVLNGLD